jgi:hypothetical protein
MPFSIQLPTGAGRTRHGDLAPSSDAVIEQGDSLADYLDRRATADLVDFDDPNQFEQVT